MSSGNIPMVVVAIFFAGAAALFHWLGPVCGSYDFNASIGVFFGELAKGGWAALLLMSMVLYLLHPQAMRRSRSFAWASGLACLLSAFLYWQWGLGQPWWSVLAMVLMIFFSLIYIGFLTFFKYAFFALSGYLVVGYAFTLLKAAVFLRGVVFDQSLAAWDAQLLGVDLYKLAAVWMQRSDMRMKVVDHVYAQLFVFMLFNLVACAYVGGKKLVRRYALALMICYFLGVLGYLLVPAYGPFVYDPVVYANGWSNGPWQVADIQRFILQRTLEVGRCTQSHIAPFAFVAAMPSLHVAVPALGAVMLWGVWRPWCLMLVPLLLTAFASVATGMHYGVDLLAGVALAIASGWLTWKLQPRDV